MIAQATWATAFRSPHPAQLECRYCCGLMRQERADLKRCACGASVTETPMEHEGKPITYREWTGPREQQQEKGT